MIETIDCAQIPAHKRLGYWRAKVAQLFPPAQVTMADPDRFEGRIQWRALGPVVISDICSVAQCVTRSKTDVDSARADVFELNLQVSGRGLLTQCGRSVVTPPDTFALYDSARPFAMQFDGPFRQLSLQVPQQMLRARIWNADAYTALALSGESGPGRALALLLEHCLRDTAALDAQAETSMASTLVDLLSQCLMLRSQDLEEQSWGRRRTLRRLKDVLLHDMADPSLTPARAAKECGISLRYAHHLFEMEDQTLSRWLLRQRLEAAKRALMAPGNSGRTLADIAFGCGFSDPAYFSRAFKAGFGISPSIMRAQSSKTALMD